MAPLVHWAQEVSRHPKDVRHELFEQVHPHYDSFARLLTAALIHENTHDLPVPTFEHLLEQEG